MAGGVKIVATQDTMQEIAQQLACWGGENRQAIVYRTDGNLPYFEIPAGVCDGATDLTLTPDGTVVTCPPDGQTTVLQPTSSDVSGVNPNTCELIEAPTGLAAQGDPTATAITVSWSAPAGGPTPTGYRVAYRQDGSTGPWSYLQAAPGQLTATATGLTPATAYDFKVQAQYGTYSSAFTAETTISTAAA